MAKRLPQERITSDTMPAHLVWNAENINAQLDPLEIPPPHVGDLGNESAWRLNESRRRLRQARAEWLATQTQRPERVARLEFLGAHGLTYSDLGRPQSKHLTL